MRRQSLTLCLFPYPAVFRFKENTVLFFHGTSRSTWGGGYMDSSNKFFPPHPRFSRCYSQNPPLTEAPHDSRDPFRRFRHAVVATVPRSLSKAVPSTPRWGQPAPGNLAACCTAGHPATNRGGECRSPLHGCGTVAPGRLHAGD